MPHEWITVANRRWCLGCSAFQLRRMATAKWHTMQGEPPIAESCSRDTDYAERKHDRG